MNRSHRPTLHTLSQPCSLLTTGRAKRWIRLILAVLIGISVRTSQISVVPSTPTRNAASRFRNALSIRLVPACIVVSI